MEALHRSMRGGWWWWWLWLWRLELMCREKSQNAVVWLADRG